MIYGHALVSNDALYIDGSEEHLSESRTRYYKGLLGGCSESIALLSVCKAINAEATPVFYSKNWFVLPDLAISKHSAFNTHAKLFRYVIVDLPFSDDCYDTMEDNRINIQPLLAIWRPVVANMRGLTGLHAVDFWVGEICDAAYAVCDVAYQSSSDEDRLTYLRYMAGQILEDLTVALGPSISNEETLGQLRFRVSGIGLDDDELEAICEAWKELRPETDKDGRDG